MIAFGKKQTPPALPCQKELLEDLQETKRQLDMARRFFESVSDPELVAASVYEVNSLQAKYSYLLHRAKEHQVRNQGISLVSYSI